MLIGPVSNPSIISGMSTRAVRAYRWACDVCVDAESDLIIPAWHGEMGTCDLSGKCGMVFRVDVVYSVGHNASKGVSLVHCGRWSLCEEMF